VNSGETIANPEVGCVWIGMLRRRNAERRAINSPDYGRVQANMIDAGK
jgi:hypothetical protein